MTDVAAGGRLVVQWPRLGPYHLARLGAVHRLTAEKGWKTVALETATGDAIHAWSAVSTEHEFDHVCLFPGESFHDLSPGAIHRAVTRALDEIDPDAVAINAYSEPDARAALEWCRRKHRVAVVMSDSRREDAPRSPIREWIKRQIVSQFDAGLTAGEMHGKYLAELGLPQDALFEPYDVVDNDYFDAAAARARQNVSELQQLPGLGDSSPYFLVVSRFIPVKNLDRLLDAYKHYRELTEQPWRLLLVGDGEEAPRLKHQVQHEEIDDVIFCGVQRFDTLPAYYGLAGALVHPALKDTWGLVVNEAMATGLPALVSRNAGCARELVVEGVTGFTFAPDDCEEIARGLATVSALPRAERLALGEAARLHVAGWSVEAFAHGLWKAVEAGHGRRHRRFSPASQVVLAALRVLARRPDSFHVVPK